VSRAGRLVGLLLLLAGAGFVASGLLSPASEPASAAAFSSSRQCRECHPQVYSEWEDSFHARAFLDEEVRKLSNEFTNEQCIDCHAPRPVFETGLAKPPLPRASRRSEGVDCIACHAREGSVVGLSPIAAGACMPRADPKLASVDHCATCHDQHQTIEEWKLTPFPAQGVTCVTCHMPSVDRNGKKGSDHASPASHDLGELQKAVSMTVAVEGRTLRVTVKNVGAGHHFPTDERSRAADLFVKLQRGDGSTSLTRLDRYRNPYRDQVGASEGLPFREESPLREKRPESTLLPFGVERRYEVDLAESAGLAEVLLLYRTLPFPTDPAEILADVEAFRTGKAFVVHREVVTW
jgi:nitrate/TMAO reductase-like tetraheme cytochrome c subunit